MSKSRNSDVRRQTAFDWYKRIQTTRYGDFAYRLKRRGFTYCQIMDYFTGLGLK